MKSRVIAHRGLWRGGLAQNSPQAIEAALLAGYGVEIDVWAAPGDYMMRVGHDADATYDLSAAIPALHAGTGTVLWNVKSTGLEHGMRLVQSRHPELWQRSFWFDFDYCGTDPELPQRFPQARYLWRPTKCIYRPGDDPSQPDGEGDGWWLEPGDEVPNFAAGDGGVFRVSPELHQRPVDLALWRQWFTAGASVCTDYCDLAARVFTQPELQPFEPWWGGA